MIVKCCNECPFLRDTPVLGGMLRFLGGDVNSGWCAYNRETKALTVLRFGLPPGPERDAAMAAVKGRLIVQDSRLLPEPCPLRTESVTVTLGS